MRNTRTVRGLGLTAMVVVGLLAAGCSGGSSGGSTAGSSSASDQPVTLTVGVFGDSFTPEMYKAYQAAHPGVTIKEVRADYGTHHNNLQAHLTAGTGTADVELIEIGQIAGFLGQSDKFVNFNDKGVDASQWTQAKARQATTADGKSLIGLPTDTGGLAICYRSDLFQAAGLPTDPAAVSALFPTWDQYVATGQQFLAKAPKGVKWFDAAGNLFNGILGNDKETYYDASGQVVAGSNPAVKSAWDLTVKAVQSGESAGLAGFTQEWNTGFQRGQFATITCPAWMLGYIQTNAPETKGKWNIATVPGGSGNWGGSFASVPSAGKHVDQAVELAKWLTDPAQAVTVYKTLGNFPSAVSTWTQPDVADAKNAFFGDAPVGKIFPDSLKNAPVQVYGPQWGLINVALGNALTTVEKGTAADKAWGQAQKDIQAAAGS
jgi:cellobiose transport system substrate-binding protein